jgi:dTDP-4-dehydrorhamnose 3,5-epimerase
MIEDVIMVPLRKIPDERGMIMHMLRCDAPHFEKFGEIYFSTAYPGIIKGWHEHTRQTQNYTVIQGMIKLVLYDNRNSSESYKELMELFVGENNYQLVKIPPGVINGYKTVGTGTAIIANCSTLPHEPNEMLRYDPKGDQVPYSWDLVMQ